MTNVTAIEPYSPFGSRGEWCEASEDQLTAFSDAELIRYNTLAAARQGEIRADKELADCEAELADVVRQARDLEFTLSTMGGRITQKMLVEEMKRVNY